jgi:hypothetical protein
VRHKIYANRIWRKFHKQLVSSPVGHSQTSRDAVHLWPHERVLKRKRLVEKKEEDPESTNRQVVVRSLVGIRWLNAMGLDRCMATDH